MLKIVSENFIHALLLFLGLFLKISRWVPLRLKRTDKFFNSAQTDNGHANKENGNILTTCKIFFAINIEDF